MIQIRKTAIGGIQWGRFSTFDIFIRGRTKVARLVAAFLQQADDLCDMEQENGADLFMISPEGSFRSATWCTLYV